MCEKGFESLAQLDDFIKKSADKRQNLQDEMEQVHTVTKYRQIYQAYKKETTDKAFANEHKSEIILYEKAIAELKKSYSKMPNSKQIFEELEKLNEKKNTLMQEYSSSKSEMTELYQIRKNYEKYMGKEMER